ncbi:unnamed protein product, partial [Didymodactylos carnosus]
MPKRNQLQLRSEKANQKRHSAEYVSSSSESDDDVWEENEAMETEAEAVQENKEPLNVTNEVFVNDIGDLF